MSEFKGTNELVLGQTYLVAHMPTKYLYERVGVLSFKSDTNLKFDLPDDYPCYFTVQTKHIISIKALSK